MPQDSLTKMYDAQLAQAGKAFAKSDDYHTYRNKYTVESAQYLLRLIGVFSAGNEVVSRDGDVVTILELGCGTGLLTGAMMEALEGKMAAVRYIASDPTASMAEVFCKNFPGVEFVTCVAEDIPLPDNSVQAVVAGASYHWFATHQAYTELYRVVTAGGRLGYISNLPAQTNGPDWCKALNELLWEAYRKSGAPWERDFRWREALLASRLFTDYVEDYSMRYFQPADVEQFVLCFASYGGVQAGTAADRDLFTHKLRALIDEHFTNKGVTFNGVPYVTEIYHCRTTKTK